MAKSPSKSVRDKRLAFRNILKRPKLTVMVGGFSPVYARAAELAGFECFFVAGSQMSGYLLGVPDNGVIGLRDVADHARHVAAGTDIPILLDTDTGFGNAVNAYYTVREIIPTGVAALQIEDQEAPKKSGTLAGRRCIPTDEAVGKYRAAVAARDELDPDFVICARCDVLGAEGGSFDDAVARSIAYVERGGADMIWLNSVETREQIGAACKAIPAPVLVIWGGGDPAPSWEEYQALGARIVLYPTLCANAGLQAAWNALNELAEDGAPALTEFARRANESKWGRANLRQFVNMDRVRELEDAFMPAGLQRNYDETWGHVGVMGRFGTTPQPGQPVKRPAKKAARRKAPAKKAPARRAKAAPKGRGRRR